MIPGNTDRRGKGNKGNITKQVILWASGDENLGEFQETV